MVSWGAGPRASQCLILGAKARAILDGRYQAAIEDVRFAAVPVLRHRLVTSFNAEAEGVTAVDLIHRLMESA
jgi:MoxR-like ATPase